MSKPTTNTAAPVKAGRVQAFTLLMNSTLPVMAIALLAPILPQLEERFGAAPHGIWLVPLIITTPALFLFFFAPVAGYLGDRFGRRRLLLVALGLYALFGVAPIYLNSLSAIIISRVLVGMAEAGVLVLSTALIGDYFKGADRDHWLGFQAAVSAVASVVLFAVGGALGSFGWRGPFALYGISLIMLVIVWRVTWEPQGIEPLFASESGAKNKFPWDHMLRVCGITIFGSILFYVIQLQSSVAFAKLGITSPPAIGLLTAIATLGTPLGAVLFNFNKLRSPSLLLSFAFTIVAVGFLTMGLAREMHFLAGGAFIAQAGCGIMLPTLLTWAARGLSFEHRGRGVGMWEGVFSIGGILSAPIVTALSLLTGTLFAAFTIFGFFSLALAAGATMLAVFYGPRASAEAV